jgi:hypothetical protein
MRTTKEFEEKLLLQGVVINIIQKNSLGVVRVFGTLEGILFTWNELGECSQGGVRFENYDLNFFNVSDDKTTVEINNVKHTLAPRRFWHRRFICTKCSIYETCLNDKSCKLMQLCTGKNEGYFKKAKQ